MKHQLFFVAAAFVVTLAVSSAYAAQEEALPDTVLENGMHVGSWSAGDAQAMKDKARELANMEPAAGDAKAPAAPAAPAEDAPHSMVVTSIQKCLDQLDPQDAAEVQRNFLHPYAECQQRLEDKMEARKEREVTKAQAATNVETPRNYMRVRPDSVARAPVPAARDEALDSKANSGEPAPRKASAGFNP